MLKLALLEVAEDVELLRKMEKKKKTVMSQTELLSLFSLSLCFS